MGARRGRHLQSAAALSTALGFVGTPTPSCAASAPRFRTRGDGWKPGRPTVQQLLTPQSHLAAALEFPFDYNIIHSTSAQALRNAIRAPGAVVIGTVLPSQAGRQRACCAARGRRCGAGPGPLAARAEEQDLVLAIEAAVGRTPAERPFFVDVSDPATQSEACRRPAHQVLSAAALLGPCLWP